MRLTIFTRRPTIPSELFLVDGLTDSDCEEVVYPCWHPDGLSPAVRAGKGEYVVIAIVLSGDTSLIPWSSAISRARSVMVTPGPS